MADDLPEDSDGDGGLSHGPVVVHLRQHLGSDGGRVSRLALVLHRWNHITRSEGQVEQVAAPCWKSDRTEPGCWRGGRGQQCIWVSDQTEGGTMPGWET